jgi:ribonuclease/clavin/mitogillin
MGNPTKFRDSSAVIMVRGKGPETQVYLVRRSDSLSFFGGYWALPGGVVDAVDGDMERDPEETLRWCAARELFEETGVLLTEIETGWTPEQRGLHRQGLLDSAGSVAWQMVRDGEDYLESLTHLGLMQTPAFAPVRYSTHFYGLEMSPDEEPVVLPGELSHGEFICPFEALEQWSRGERLIVPPVRTLLELLTEGLKTRFGWRGFIVRAPARLKDFEGAELPPILNSPGIYMLPLKSPTLPPATTTNTYLVGHEDFYVVDPGTHDPGEQKLLIEFLRQRTSDGERLRGILLTHEHEDHVGGVKCLQDAFNVPVFAHAETLSRVKDVGANPVTVQDRTRLSLGKAPDGSADWFLEAIHTPGHAVGHLVFRDSRYGSVIGGDMASTVSTIVIDPPEGHLATYLNSLQVVHDLGPGLFYPAHGPVARDGQALMLKYIAHRADREQQLIHALRGKPKTKVKVLVPLVYTDVPKSMYALAASSLLAGLIKLEEDGLARNAGGRWSLLAD